jgi:large subunit ribosomal protein L29
MKQEHIRELTDKELVEAVADEQTNLTRMRLAHAVNPLESSMKLKNTRKLVARLKTEIRNREIQKQSENK